MNEKKRQILEAAIQCFAKKGYHETSIQEITDTLGIAKGSVYFYFESKKELFNSAFKYMLDLGLQDYQEIANDPSLSPRDKLYQQVIRQYHNHVEYKDFIHVLIRDRFEITEEIGQLIASVRGRALYQYQGNIVEVYGEEVAPYALDAANIFLGMTHHYLQLSLEQEEHDFHRMALFFLERLDDVVHGMISKQQPPIFDAKLMDELLASGKLSLQKQEPNVFHEIQTIRQLLESLELSAEKREDIESALLVIEEEAKKTERRPVVIRGMVAFLRGLKINEIKSSLINIERLYK